MSTVVRQLPPSLNWFDLDQLPKQPRFEWADDARCAAIDTSVFYPEDQNEAAYNDARAVCALCPVAYDCLAYALHTEQHGCWGRMSPYQRGKLRRALQARSAAA